MGDLAGVIGEESVGEAHEAALGSDEAVFEFPVAHQFESFSEEEPFLDFFRGEPCEFVFFRYRLVIQDFASFELEDC